MESIWKYGDEYRSGVEYYNQVVEKHKARQQRYVDRIKSNEISEDVYTTSHHSR